MVSDKIKAVFNTVTKNHAITIQPHESKSIEIIMTCEKVHKSSLYVCMYVALYLLIYVCIILIQYDLKG